MPLPISHSLAGAAVYTAFDQDGGSGGWRRLVIAISVANAPDLDLLPGLLIGDPNRFHRGASHSLITALGVGLLFGWLAWLTRGWEWRLRGHRLRGPYQTAFIVAVLLASHVLLDAFTTDPSPPAGEQMLWPLSDAWVQLYPLFDRADKVSGPASASEFVRSLLSMHNARAMGRELVLVGPFLLWARWWRRRNQTHRSSSAPC